MPNIFDSKLFNAEVFQGYLDRIENPRKAELIKSRAIRLRPDLAAAMRDQTGGNYITTPMLGLIDGAEEQNYDGEHDITSHSTKTFAQSRVVVGRANAWTEKDFSYDVTGEDFLENVAAQIADYWDKKDQDTIVSILNGIFKMADEAGIKFVKNHTYNVTGITNSQGTVGHMDGTTINTAMQRACGDGKNKFSVAIMHSVVATNLENLNLLGYLKYTDDEGITRDLGIATINGRLVLIDDSMPTDVTVTTDEVKGVYTITIGTKGVTGDTLTVGGVTYTLGDTTSYEDKTLAVGSSASTQAAALADLLAYQYDGIFAVTVNAAVVTLTQVIGGTGAIPAVSKTGTIAATAATTTAGVAKVETATYTTYVLGDGAIEYTDCGAKVPSEMYREPGKNGGQDTLYSRQRKCFAPYGISFTKKRMATLSPTKTELQLGINWELVNSVEETGTEYISDKVIPIARIISLG